jgi:hypothetical protein
MAEDSLPIISAREAYDAGKTRYFTGEPCKYGHVAERMVANGCCAECLRLRDQTKREYFKAWKKANPDKIAEYSKRYAARHPETHDKAAKKWRAAHLEEIRKRDRDNARIRRAGNPDAEKARLARWNTRHKARQEDLAGRPRPEVCDICGQFDRRIVFDHCHASGAFRGWLCDRCNRTLGHVKDNTQLLTKMIAYLEGHYGSAEGRSEEQASGQ